MQDFPANSKAAKTTEPREQIKPVTSAEAVRRKRGVGRQFRETFFSGSASDAFEYMVTDVIVPAIRDTLYEAMQGGLERIIFGDRQGGRARRAPSTWGSTNLGHFDYQGISQPAKKTQAQRAVSRSSRARHDFHELVIPTRQDAEDVIDRMFDILSSYGQVSVADLYALTDVQAEHTDLKWGWTNLGEPKALPDRRRGGFILSLPKPEELGR